MGLLVRPRHKLENNNKMYLKEMGLEGADWIAVAQDRNKCQKLVNTAINLPGISWLFEDLLDV